MHVTNRILSRVIRWVDKGLTVRSKVCPCRRSLPVGGLRFASRALHERDALTLNLRFLVFGPVAVPPGERGMAFVEVEGGCFYRRRGTFQAGLGLLVRGHTVFPPHALH
eukprot:1184566-Prorocentrum_minimum.AAC.3